MPGLLGGLSSRHGGLPPLERRRVESGPVCGGEGGEVAEPRADGAHHHPGPALPERGNDVGEVPAERPVRLFHGRVVRAHLVVEEELHAPPLGGRVLPPWPAERAEELPQAGGAERDGDADEPEPWRPTGEHGAGPVWPNHLVVPGVDHHHVRRLAGEVARHRHQHVRVDGHHPRVHHLEPDARGRLLEHRLEEAGDAERRLGVSLRRGLAEHHHPDRPRTPLLRQHERRGLPGQPGREEAEREVRVGTGGRAALRLAGNGKAGRVAHAEQSQEQLEPAQEHHWREHHGDGAEQPDPSRGGRRGSRGGRRPGSGAALGHRPAQKSV